MLDKMNNQKIIFLFGDRMKNFCIHDNMLTYSEIIIELRKDKIFNRYESLFIAHGIDMTQSHLIKNLISLKYPEMKIRHLSGWEDKENKKLVHKNHDKNVLISKPKQEFDNQFRSFILLDNDCDIICDHITRQHFQGTLIIEAARQMMLSTIENYFFSENNEFNRSFIIKNITTQFFSFSFPLDIMICAKLKFKILKKNYICAIISCNFYQYNNHCAKINIEFRVIQTKEMFEKEISFFIKALDQAC